MLFIFKKTSTVLQVLWDNRVNPIYKRIVAFFSILISAFLLINCSDSSSTFSYDPGEPVDDGFYSMSDIYKSLAANERVVFVIRHAERTSDYSFSGPLTREGKKQAKYVGTTLVDSNVTAFYAYSGFVRTLQTVEAIADGRDDDNIKAKVLEGLDGNWFVQDDAKFEEYKNTSGGGWVVVSKYAYTGEFADAFYVLADRAEEFVTKHVLPSVEGQKLSIMATHDTFLVPFVVYATSGTVDVKHYETGRWLNYLAGVAIIIGEDGSIRYLPTKGLASGIM